MQITSIRDIANHSDHDAISAVFRIAGDDIVITSWNAGDHGTVQDLHNLCMFSDIVMLQEVGDWSLKAALPKGWSFLAHDRVALAWRDSMPPKRTDTFPLHGRVWGGPGAGPDHVNPKSIVFGVWNFDGRDFSIGAIHLVASQQNRLRWLIARLEVRGVLRWLRRQNRVILGGDWNTQTNARVLRRLVHRLHVSQHIATHGKRAIDFFLYGRS